MKINHLFAICLLFILNISCGDKKGEQGEIDMETNDEVEEHEFTNKLVHESSPYLLQHAHNPVNWHAWNEETLKKAKKENKLLVISIGYAACHWCHVMEDESFEDPEVAGIMNENFISIKVDREERPDVDNIYMNAAQLMTGSGGWPLNVLALPDGRPFYAGTYFPKEDWLKVLKYFVDLNNDNPASIKEQAEKVTQGIHSLENIPLIEKKAAFAMEDLKKSYQQIKTNIDFENGGKEGAPKFPTPVLWKFLLHYSYLTADKSALDAVTTTLNEMATGGIYDHLGGGFARYSVDEEWLVPHFEKMLYDNAQLVELYSQAWRKTKDPLYKQVVYESLAFVENELTAPNGGFYSSLDADTEGEEGKFYVWTASEIDAALKDDAKLFREYYNISESGNWENQNNILHRKETNKEFAEKRGIGKKELNTIIAESKSKLIEVRQNRISPALDDKILTSWNALMIKGYVSAYNAFGEQRFLNAAIKNADFLSKNVISKNGKITRNYKDGKSSIPGFLDDYAFVISAYIDLYQATFDEKWLHKAHEITSYTRENFFDPASKMFFYNHNEHSGLITRQKEILDNVIPSSNSEMAKNLLFLGHFYGDSEKTKMAEQMLVNVQENLREHPDFYSNWAIVEAYFVQPPFEVAIVGREAKELKQQLNQTYLPNILIMGGEEEGNLELLQGKLVSGKTMIYVCKNYVCKFPVTTVDQALNQLNDPGFW